METAEGTYNAGNNTLPDDWPTDAPIYTGAIVQYSGSTAAGGKPGAGAVLTSADSTVQVVAFYKAELAKQGWTMTTVMESQGTTIMGANKDDRTLSLLVGSADGQTTITIGIGKQ